MYMPLFANFQQLLGESLINPWFPIRTYICGLVHIANAQAKCSEGKMGILATLELLLLFPCFRASTLD